MPGNSFQRDKFSRVIAALAARFAFELQIADDDPLVDCLAHVVNVSAATAAAVMASISTPVAAVVAAVARIAMPPATTSAFTSTN